MMIQTLLVAAIILTVFYGVVRMSEALDRLTASVTNLTNVSASAVTLITGLAAEIRSLNDDGDADGLAALADKLDADSASLAAAITASTPVATAPGVQPDPSVSPVPPEAPVEEQPADPETPAT